MKYESVGKVIQKMKDSNDNLYLLTDDGTLYINDLATKDKYTKLYSYSYGFIVGITKYNSVKVLFNNCTYVNQEKWTKIIENDNKPYKKIIYDTLYFVCLTRENTANVIWFNFENDDKSLPTANELLEIHDVDNIFPCDEYKCYLKMMDGKTITIKDYINNKNQEYIVFDEMKEIENNVKILYNNTK